MLAREQRGRADDGDLQPRHCRDEGGTQRNLGLAETDIADDEAVHRLARCQIVEHFADRAVLIVGFLVGKAIDEARIAARIRLRDLAGPQGALGGDRDQLTRDFADAILHLRLAALPRLAAEPVERPGLVAAIAAEHVDILNGHIELVAAGIFKRDAIMRALADRDLREAGVAANAVIDMDDEIAGRQRRQFSEESIGGLAALGPAHEPVAEHVLLGQHRDIGGSEAMVERQDDQRDIAAGGKAQRFLPAIGLHQPFEAVIGEQPRQPVTRADRIAGEHEFT